LHRVEGVRNASVNLATENAKVVFDPSIVGLDGLSSAVVGLGRMKQVLADEDYPAESVA
jgi:copper chaperone CopZ